MTRASKFEALLISSALVASLSVSAFQTSFNSTENSTETGVELVYRSYTITCCRNGQPKADGDIAEHILEWSQEHVGKMGLNDSCNRFTGYYSLPLDVFVANRHGSIGVRCQCPGKKDHLDRNCRYVPPCQNSGYRSFRINLRCVCPPTWFGELCEKYCYKGSLVKVKGLDSCRCKPHFYGDECNQVKCFHGGTPVSGQGCICRLPYLGQHCEVQLNNTSLHLGSHHVSPMTRDISGSVISLLLVVGLAFLIYLIIRRKTQVLARRRLAVRNTLAGREFESHMEDINLSNLQHFSDPPPYNSVPVATYMVPNSMMSNANSMPPLPSYDDALKLPAGMTLSVENSAAEIVEVPENSENAQDTVEEPGSEEATLNSEDANSQPTEPSERGPDIV